MNDPRDNSMDAPDPSETVEITVEQRARILEMLDEGRKLALEMESATNDMEMSGKFEDLYHEIADTSSR